MKSHIITIFPESFDSYFKSSIVWNAINKGLFEPVFYKLNDFSDRPQNRVDDKAYWMHWQVISAEPISKCIDFIFEKVWKKIPVIYMTPSWDLLCQGKVENYLEILWEEFIIICGHYEWIDSRIVDLYVDYEISIWEYVLSSWEISAMVFLDSMVRNISWVLWNSKSLMEESFSKDFFWKKEHPIYTRPQEFKGKKVPEVLMSWNHKKIEEWKYNNLK